MSPLPEVLVGSGYDIPRAGLVDLGEGAANVVPCLLYTADAADDLSRLYDVAGSA